MSWPPQRAGRYDLLVSTEQGELAVSVAFTRSGLIALLGAQGPVTEPEPAALGARPASPALGIGRVEGARETTGLRARISSADTTERGRAIERSARRRAAEIAYCHTRRREDAAAGEQGRLVLEVSSLGDVTSARYETDVGEAIAACVETNARRWTFTADAAGPAFALDVVLE